MSRGRTVLIVDDDKEIVEMMTDFLEDEQFNVLSAYNASQAIDLLETNGCHIDCLLLDVMMPGTSGLELCRQLRRTMDIPILFLSARGEDVDKIRGLSLGGDDYIVKSATPEEVVARIKAVLRRSDRNEKAANIELRFGRLVLDMTAHEVKINDQPISITPKEFEILSLFAEYPRQVFTYEQLLNRFWDGVGDKHTVTVLVGRIREKIEVNPRKPTYIMNVWGVGYRFEGVRQ
ncbi:response regulator transcription factor [Paenibacillus sp. N1-5-1-14]|uniref:response regulator transcription factor n=1 Tax=Paenibacillus radicibacter TaxID=2972488 RepID=UPI00215926E7|nr:response regulator transcription factor [Paenibacillus radicibacter]MCR8644260.1 response regulator transcription factor [Paenibacillus radicibacter]